MQNVSAEPANSLSLGSEYKLPKAIPQLDRLRGLAILLVLICHSEHIIPRALAKVAYQGWVGVDLFFVLSGFLITGILWDTREDKHYFRRFYGRRILRIWPVYLIVLFFAFCIIPFLKWSLGGPILDFPKEPLGIWAFLLMIQNLFGNRLFLSPLLGVTWSLAIEEQFYLVWPAVIRYLSRLAALPCLFAGIFLAPILRIFAMHLGYSQPAIYYCPLTHGEGLLCGAAVAIWLRSARPKRRTLLLAGAAILFAGLALFSTVETFTPFRHYCSPLVFTGAAFSSTGLLLLALVSENLGRTLHRIFFMNRKLAFFGFISYGLYLYHILILRFAMSDRLASMGDWWHHPYLTNCIFGASGLGLSILIAWISRITIERAALSKKGIFD